MTRVTIKLNMSNNDRYHVKNNVEKLLRVD